MRRAIIVALTAVLLSISASSVCAGGEAQNATITQMAIYRSLGNFVLIAADVASTGAPACSTNTTWRFTLSLDGVAGRELYAMLLAAQTSGRKVHLAGTGLCSEFAAVESLNGMYYLN